MHIKRQYYFVSPGIILVETISIETILVAVEHCLYLAQNDYILFEHFGVLQKEK